MAYPNAIARANAVPAWSTSKFVLAAAAEEAPVPPLATDRSVPLHSVLLIVLAVASEPSPKVVRAVDASASSINEPPNVEIEDVSTLSLFRFVKFASSSALVRGEPLPDLVVIVAIGYAPSNLKSLTV